MVPNYKMCISPPLCQVLNTWYACSSDTNRWIRERDIFSSLVSFLYVTWSVLKIFACAEQPDDPLPAHWHPSRLPLSCVAVGVSRWKYLSRAITFKKQGLSGMIEGDEAGDEGEDRITAESSKKGPSTIGPHFQKRKDLILALNMV